MKPLFAFFALIFLVACGVDGEPMQPQATSTVTLSSSGAHVQGGVGVSRGPLTLILGF